MRIFVSGTGGAAGARLVPQLIGHGHNVIRNCRSPGTAMRIGVPGAGPFALIQAPAHAWCRAGGSS
jgi:hypothetical protein